MQSRSEAEGAELLARLAIAEATIRQLKDQFKSRETDIIETKKNFDDACKESQILKLDLKRLKESNSRMKIESLVKERTIKDLNTACETHYRVEQDLYGKVKSLQSSIHNKDALIKDLRAKLDALMSELAPIKQTLQQLDALKQVHSKCKGDFARKELLVQQWKQRAEKSEKARSLLQELQSAKHHRPTAFHQPANPDAISPFTTSTAAAPHFDTTSYAPQPAAQADWPQRPRSAPTFDGRRPGRRGVPDTASPPRRASPSRPSPQRLRGRANEDVRLEAVVDGVARCAATAAVRHAEEAVARWREQLAPQPDLAAGGEKQAGGRKIERVARELLNVDYELILRGKTETPESVASALRAIIDEASQADWNDAAQTNLSTRICVYLTAVLSQSYCKSPTPFPIAAL
ncbi:hypothetical protein DFJ73DRAFT_94299 [Zopfochytrium polystomum]|nr:hypothetical protein DFJ73DRAFT_94299 [Zopfochytrium polystomum]